ncbi:dihydroxyacetone kinase subunit DhaL [Gryllotalpicola protaetiae]|uniref:Dihydroxyacetone kinase subunit L n=1 Tax=Gryllotalpicola protaetiae TaxID=2419771 RepID=A0A387BGJ1_9MICO|nr:dihydroxyacetone kinase subunit DhaL [Gryllotalpicola protaetiae]AYG03043.1 dihydroxyacetone kinase subunit L [Gryllotalpicola protaetiae]
MGAATLNSLVAWLHGFAALVAANRDHLTELDSAIGDADHGSNLDRGMTAVVAALDAQPATDTADLFKRTGMALISNVGGASGPLFGTFFLRLGGALGASSSVSSLELASALRAGVSGVTVRGKAELGDKTMLDVLVPALDAWDAAPDPGDVAGAARAAAEAAAAARDATAPLVAHKGRASYLGERSAGHLDPGAASTALLFRALAEALEAPGAAEQ